MDFSNFKSIKDYGFVGYIPVSQLMQNQSIIPHSRGVYMVLYTPDISPKFLNKGSGGFFKGKDPNVPIEELKVNWVNDTKVIYIGTAGGGKSAATLHSRIKQLVKFGRGKNVGHSGGRLIWQIENNHDLIICWKELRVDDPYVVKKQLMRGFKNMYRKRPFANLVD
ncbi:hypothetical protein [Bacillus sp. REN16]|uniref:hypothetical protein n=1 Tax=Bacillus sp. REN16 TaxID=2887296 RepID=UPI001E54FD01|nr:hypothetical protein [Bacillus sp. REN16]MCC3357142.1 hypothetical protein [Bacillus sp. REN16]